MMIKGVPFVVVGLSTDQTETFRRIDELKSRSYLYGLGLGCYEGNEETVALIWNSDDIEEDIKELAIEWDESSILAVDANREAYLIDCELVYSDKPAIKRIGQWKRVKSIENEPAWTHYEGNYYVAK